ncbi:MAG: DUF86 domain-containing protein [Planctomycetota bacterium]|nr:DUF86 domain-containing protein [Planctomycetota bacterium]
MHPDVPKLLEDIRDAGAFVLQIVHDCSQEEYEQNRLARQAVERNFEIIGEALNRLSKTDPLAAQQVGPVTKIVAFRNILVHAYDNIDHQIVWHVIQNELPQLVAAVETLLQDADSASDEDAKG